MSINNILQNYQDEPPSVIGNLRSIFNHGKLGGSGKLLILPVDQGFEHGPDQSFYDNQAAYNPKYHPDLALSAGFNAYAAPIGMIAPIAREYAGILPMILKINSSNKVSHELRPPHQAITSSVEEAIRLGCSAIGLTIYPGSQNFDQMLEFASRTIEKARSLGLPSVVWAYPRGGDLDKDGESALDIIGYAAHIAALIGAHIIKVKLPNAKIYRKTKKCLANNRDINNLSHRVEHIMKCALNRIVIFSGGSYKNENDLLQDAAAIKNGGGFGSIIGRNAFQRDKTDAVRMVDKISEIYKSA